MRTFKNYMDALKKQREERGEDGGFSLIELIVVVVILGILVAIAIPVFLNIQASARINSLDAAASDGAVVVAAAIADSTGAVGPVAAAITANNANTATEYTLSVLPAEPTEITAFCVTAEAVTGGPLDGAPDQTAGPDCP